MNGMGGENIGPTGWDVKTDLQSFAARPHPCRFSRREEKGPRREPRPSEIEMRGGLLATVHLACYRWVSRMMRLCGLSVGPLSRDFPNSSGWR
jgi:hypothetical protein